MLKLFRSFLIVYHVLSAYDEPHQFSKIPRILNLLQSIVLSSQQTVYLISLRRRHNVERRRGVCIRLTNPLFGNDIEY